MSFEVRIPPMGESVSEAVIGRWIKHDGDLVAADDPLLELESDKANMELAAESAGVLKTLRNAGDTVKEGDVVALIEAVAATGRPARASDAPQTVAATTAHGAPSVADTGGPVTGPGQSSAAPANAPAPPAGDSRV